MYWYGKGKELGDPRCAYGVGAYYHFWNGVEQDKAKAKQIHIEEYKLLLELIDEEEQNPRKQVFELIHDCAVQGHILAIYDLGEIFIIMELKQRKT